MFDHRPLWLYGLFYMGLNRFRISVCPARLVQRVFARGFRGVVNSKVGITSSSSSSSSGVGVYVPLQTSPQHYNEPQNPS